MPTTFAQTASATTPSATGDHPLLVIARVCLGITAGAFGVRYLVNGKLLAGLPPLPPWLPGAPVLAYLAGVLLLAAAIALVLNLRARTAATVLGGLLCLAALLYLTHPLQVLANGGVRTGFLEPLSLAAAAWMLAGATPPSPRDPFRVPAALPTTARYLLAATLIVFGIQHFEYLAFVAMLVPAWLHSGRVWTAITGLAFIAAGASVATRLLDRAAGLALAAMFFLWLLVLHGPRIAAHPQDGNEWTSGFVALGFLAAGLLIAVTARKHQPFPTR